MRHRMQKRKLGMKTAHRIAVMRNMVTSLMEYGQIKVTLQRAKELRKLADHMVTLAKTGTLHARRQALSVIRRKEAVDKLFLHWGPLFVEKNGGYSRIIKIGQRKGDAAEMTIIEMATDTLEHSSTKKKAAKKLNDLVAPVIPHSIQEHTDIVASEDATSEVDETAQSELTQQQILTENFDQLPAEGQTSENVKKEN